MFLVLLLKAILVYLSLWLVLWVFSRFFHRTLYTDVPEGLLWRSATAAGMVWGWGLLLPLLSHATFGWNWPITFDNYFVGRTLTDSDEIEFQAFLVSMPEGERRYELQRVTQGQRQERQYISANGDRLSPATLAPQEGDGDAARTFRGVYIGKEENREEKSLAFSARTELTGLKFYSTEGHEMAAEEFGVVRLTSAAGFFFRMVGFVVLIAVWFAVFAFALEFARVHAWLSGLAGAFLWVLLLNTIQWTAAG